MLNAAIKRTLRSVVASTSIFAMLFIQGCGGTSATPTLWESPQINTTSTIQKLIKADDTTVSRLTYNNETLAIEHYDLNGVFLSEQNTPLNVGKNATLIPVNDGYIWSSSTYINMVKFDENWDVDWTYQQSTQQGDQRYQSIFTSPSSDIVLIATNDEVSPSIIMLENGVETHRYTTQNPAVTLITHLTISGDFIYAYQSSTTQDGALIVFNQQLEIVSENTNSGISNIIPSPSGIVYASDNTLTAVNHNLSTLWQTQSPNALSLSKVRSDSNNFYLYADKRQETVNNYYTASVLVESYNYEDGFEWQHRIQRTGYEMRLSQSNITLLDTGELALSYSQDTSSLPDITNALATRHSFNIRHQLFTRSGELTRSITEATYRYNKTACLGGWGFCIPAAVFIGEGNSYNYGVVSGNNEEFISLSHVAKGIEGEFHSVLAAY